jgi:hypothetical protein
MHKNATKCNETLSKWCKNKHGASKIIDTFETYQLLLVKKLPRQLRTSVWRHCPECLKVSGHQPSEVWLSPTSSINLGFTTEGNLLMCSSYLPLGVPNWVPNTHYHWPIDAPPFPPCRVPTITPYGRCSLRFPTYTSARRASSLPHLVKTLDGLQFLRCWHPRSPLGVALLWINLTNFRTKIFIF